MVGKCNSYNLTISECSSEVDFYIGDATQRYIGGLFGFIAAPGSFTNCHFDGCFMNESGEVIDSGTSLSLGAAIGEHYARSSKEFCTFTNCSYYADKTGNIPKVKKPLEGQDYSGIIAK